MQLLRPFFPLSAMPKVVHGKKGGPPSTSGVRRSTRRVRMPSRLVDEPVASTATMDVAELQAENELLRQQLEQTQSSDADLPTELPVLGEQLAQAVASSSAITQDIRHSTVSSATSSECCMCCEESEIMQRSSLALADRRRAWHARLALGLKFV